MLFLVPGRFFGKASNQSELTTECSMSRLAQSSLFSRRNIRRLNARHTRNINHPARRLGRRPLQQQRLKSHRHIKNTLHIQRHELIPRGLREIVIIITPSRAGVIHEDSESVDALFDFSTERHAAGLVFQVGDDVGAFSGAEGVEARSSGLELGFFARGDDYVGAVLDEGLGGHFAQAGGSARDEGNVVTEVIEGGDAKVVFGGLVGHCVVDECCGVENAIWGQTPGEEIKS